MCPGHYKSTVGQMWRQKALENSETAKLLNDDEYDGLYTELTKSLQMLVLLAPTLSTLNTRKPKNQEVNTVNNQ